MKPFLKKIFKYLFKTLLVFVSLILIYIAFAFLLPYIKVNSHPVKEKKEFEIFVLSNGVHTDLVFPVKSSFINWNGHFPYSDFKAVDSTFNFIAMGWGDKGFYLDTPTWADLKFSTAFNAAFGLGSTAMHVTYRRYKPKEGELCKSIFISEEQYQKLFEYIASSFQLEDGDTPIRINHDGYNSSDCFYEATGCYSMFKTCNVWTGNALKKANIQVGIWTPFDKGVLNSVN